TSAHPASTHLTSTHLTSAYLAGIALAARPRDSATAPTHSHGRRRTGIHPPSPLSLAGDVRMSDTAPFDHTPLLDPLVIHLDQAAEQMRRANQLTYVTREVTDLPAVLAALHTLFSRFDQLAGYLAQTVAQADAVDFRHDQGGDVALTLTAVEDGLTRARGQAAHTTR